MTSRELVAESPVLASADLERLTGVRERRVCDVDEDSLTLALEAARDCLAHSEHEASDLDLVLCTSITRYEGVRDLRLEPTFAGTLARTLGAEHALAFDLSNACAGMCTGVAVANAMVRTGSIRRALVVSGEYITSLALNARRSIRDLRDPQLASLTLGDAGAAVIVDRCDDPDDAIVASEFTTLAVYSDLCVGKPSRVGHGAQMFTDTQAIHDISIANGTRVVARTIESAGLRYEDIDFVIPHQTSKWALRRGQRTVDAALKTEGPGPVYLSNLTDYGNTSSTTHFLALRRFLEEGLFEAHHRVLLAVAASGLVVGGLVFKIGKLWRRYGEHP